MTFSFIAYARSERESTFQWILPIKSEERDRVMSTNSTITRFRDVKMWILHLGRVRWSEASCRNTLWGSAVDDFKETRQCTDAIEYRSQDRPRPAARRKWQTTLGAWGGRRTTMSSTCVPPRRIVLLCINVNTLIMAFRGGDDKTRSVTLQRGGIQLLSHI